MTDTHHDAIPKWIFWYGAIILAGFPLVTGVITLTGSNIGTVALADGTQMDTGLFKYAIRNIAAAVAMGFALYMRSAAMLVVVLIMRFITEAGDLLDGLLFGDMGTTGILSYIGLMVVFAFVPYTIAIRQLWPMVRSRR